MSLIDVHRILIKNRENMFSFADNYLFTRSNVQRNEILNNQDNFIRVIRFCINTRQQPVNAQRENAIAYFSFHYTSIANAIKQGDWGLLKDLIYIRHRNNEYMTENRLNGPIGVGQKIGSFILEALIHYGETNPDLESKLYVPIDTHVHHIFSECLGIDMVPDVNATITSRRYLNFQKMLLENTYNNQPRIYFDYLWFIGKIFCTQRENGNGYRLCNLCWIREDGYCVYPNKWFPQIRS